MLSVIVDVVVSGSTEDSGLVNRMKRLLHSASSDEFRKVKELVELREQGVNLMDVRHGSIRLYFWCLNGSSVRVLKEWLETGRLQTVIEKLFVLVSSSSSPKSLRLSFDSEQFDRAIRIFTKRATCNGEYRSTSEFISADLASSSE